MAIVKQKLSCRIDDQTCKRMKATQNEIGDTNTPPQIKSRRSTWAAKQQINNNLLPLTESNAGRLMVSSFLTGIIRRVKFFSDKTVSLPAKIGGGRREMKNYDFQINCRNNTWSLRRNQINQEKCKKTS